MHDADREHLIAAFRDSAPMTVARMWDRYLPQVVTEPARRQAQVTH